MLETPVTSDEVVTWFLSNLPAYKSAVSPVTRGVEIGLAHGYFISGPWIKLGPFRSLEYPLPEVVGCISGVGACCLLFFAMIGYGLLHFKDADFILPAGVGTKTLSGRPI
jgi:photosystem I subunit 11